METPTLEGPVVRLEPLSFDHFSALEEVAFDRSIWRYMIYPMRDTDDLRSWVQIALDAKVHGTALPWVTILKGKDGAADRLVGATRFLDLSRQHRTVEIGNTWLIDQYRGTRVNTEAKLLQLTFAFDELDLLRVAFKTHIANHRSIAAIKAIGAHYEGTFRNHYILADGSHRDSDWYSIIRSEWHDVKELLTRRLKAPV